MATLRPRPRMLRPLSLLGRTTLFPQLRETTLLSLAIEDEDDDEDEYDWITRTIMGILMRVILMRR